MDERGGSARRPAPLGRGRAGRGRLLAGLPAILSDHAPGTFRAVQHVEELTRTVELLAREEERVSTHRRAVQRVVDVLRGALVRRYRDGTAQVSQLLE